MTSPTRLPHAVFSGSWGDRATGRWHPAQAAVSDGFVTLSTPGPTGWTQRFSVPAREVTVKSAAQRITLVVRGQSYPILADPGAANRAMALATTGIVGNIAGVPGVSAGSNVGRGLNQAAAARAFNAQGGAAFLAAMRASGARVSRVGYGALVAISCVAAVFIVLATVVITVAVLNG